MIPIRLKARLVGLAIVLAWCAAACSPSSQQKAISDTMTALNAASAAFVAFDASHQQSIVAQASSKAAGEAALASYRADQLKVQTALTVGYRAVATAATVQSQPNLDGMILAAAQVAAVLQSLGVKVP